jgi:hypothetical protein
LPTVKVLIGHIRTHVFEFTYKKVLAAHVRQELVEPKHVAQTGSHVEQAFPLITIVPDGQFVTH